MKDTLLSSQASHATRGTISRQPLGAPDQAYQTKTRMSNPDPSPGQSHDHPDRQTASRRLDQVYQIRSPKSTRLTSPATTPSNPETNPDHPCSQPPSGSPPDSTHQQSPSQTRTQAATHCRHTISMANPKKKGKTTPPQNHPETPDNPARTRKTIHTLRPDAKSAPGPVS